MQCYKNITSSYREKNNRKNDSNFCILKVELPILKCLICLQWSCVVMILISDSLICKRSVEKTGGSVAYLFHLF